MTTLTEAVDRLLRAEFRLHRSYGSTATCREGGGFFAGAAITPHCAQSCSNPAHDSDSREFTDALRGMKRILLEQGGSLGS